MTRWFGDDDDFLADEIDKHFNEIMNQSIKESGIVPEEFEYDIFKDLLYLKGTPYYFGKFII